MNDSDLLENLIGDYLDGVLDQKGEQELADLLATSADARKLLAAHMRIHGAVRQLGKAGGIRAHSRENKLRENPPSSARRTRIAAVIAGLAASVVLLVGCWIVFNPAKPENPIIATVEEAREAFRLSGDQETELQKGMPIRSGENIRTADIAIIRFSDGTRVTMDERGDVTFSVEDGAKQINLYSGLLELDVTKQPAGKPLAVQTPHARVTVVGTKFQVEASNKHTEVEVIEGIVRLEAIHSGKKSVETHAGEIALVDEQGRITSEKLPVFSDTKRNSDTIAYWEEGKKRIHIMGCRRLPVDPKELAKMSKMTLAEAEKKGIPLCSKCPGSTTPGKRNPRK